MLMEGFEKVKLKSILNYNGLTMDAATIYNGILSNERVMV
jgi:hypothetical protein